MRRLISVNIIVVLLFILLCTVACGPASNAVSDSIAFEIEGSTLVITGSGATPDYDVDGETAAPWANREPCSIETHTIEKVRIGKGISYLGRDSFSWFSELTEVILPTSLTDIGEFCFYGCKKLKSIELPQNLKSIGAHAFHECIDLVMINLPEGLETIGESAFSACVGLEMVYIPSSVTEIGSWVFDHCWALREIVVSPENERYYSQDGVLFDRVRNELVMYPAARDAEAYHIPDGIERIGKGAFNSCRLTEIEFPSTVLFIESGAFSDAKELCRVTLPDKLTAIEQDVFSRCENLGYIRIPDSVAYLNADAFYGCNNLTSIDIRPENLYLCLKDGVIYNKEQTALLFYPPALTNKVYLAPKSLEKIADYAIRNNEYLTKVILPEEMIELGQDSFQDVTSLEEIQMPNRLYSIREGSFLGCEALKQITIPYGVTAILCETLCFCDVLEEIVIADTVEMIEKHALMGFHGKVIFEGTKKEWKSICIEDSKMLKKITIEYAE